ncbi:MAG: hypothetical protein AcusKO_27830 [Acuticoccus sp.]
MVSGKPTFETADKERKAAYDLFSILDNKARALLSFNGIVLAVIALWLQYVGLNFLHLILDLVFIAFLVSSYILLNIIRLYWSTLEETVQELEELRQRRTRSYRRAWRISISSVLAVIVVSVVHTAGTALVATDRCPVLCEWFYSPDVFGNIDYANPAPGPGSGSLPETGAAN